MSEPNGFDRDYFIQTRKEIDTEKRERDQMLNFAILVLGAIGFVIYQSETAQKFLREPEAMAIEIPALVIISSLFWVRYRKLRQISDRWFTLNRMLLRYFDEKRVEEMLEGIVVKDLKEWRYIKKDIILNIALCLPIYGLLLIPFFRGWCPDQRWRLILTVVVIVAHSLLSSVVLGRKFIDPLPPLSDVKSTIKENQEINKLE